MPFIWGGEFRRFGFWVAGSHTWWTRVTVGRIVSVCVVHNHRKYAHSFRPARTTENPRCQCVRVSLSRRLCVDFALFLHELYSIFTNTLHRNRVTHTHTQTLWHMPAQYEHENLCAPCTKHIYIYMHVIILHYPVRRAIS